MNTDDLRSKMESTGIAWRVADDPLDARERLGYLPSRGVPSLEEQERIAREVAEEPAAALGAAAPTYPPACDLRSLEGRNYVTAVQNQASCLSCVAFACCAVVEGTLRFEQRNPNLDVDLSEAYLWYCVAVAQQGRSCAQGPNAGWWPKDGLTAFQSPGVPDDPCFPYTAGDQPCNACADAESRSTRIAAWRPLHTPADMKQWICSHGPVVGSMQVYEDFQHYAGGIYKYVSGGALGGHAVCVVGYDDVAGAWIVKNSWGSHWGEQGFFRMGYGECGLDSGGLGVEGVQAPSNSG